MEETIDLREYFTIIKKRFWIVILITVIAVGISIVILHLNKVQLYKAETTMIVNVQSNENQLMLTSDQIYDQIYAGEKLGVVYGEIIKSRAVLNPVIERLNLDISTEQLAKMISISQVEDTHIMTLSVTDTDPDRAKDIANTIPGVFTEEVKRTIKANGVEVIDPSLGGDPMPSNILKKVLIVGVVGVMIGIFIIFLIEFLDNKVKTPQDMEKYFNIPVLGVIPNENK